MEKLESNTGKRIAVFSFFSGCGLLDLGFEESGFDIKFVNEKYKPFLDAYVYSRDILGIDKPVYGYHNIDVEEFLKKDDELCKIVQIEKGKNIVGFIGGPPCPDFSTAGKNKGKNGENGKLTKSYFDLISKQQPDFFVFENVKGLWKTKKHRVFYDQMRKKMQSKGYFVFDKLINALEYGVPQDRERIIMIGIRIDSKKMKNDISSAIANFQWGIVNKNNIIEIIKNIEWPETDKYIEDSVKEMPENLLREYTVQYWFDKNGVDNHANAKDYFKPRQGLSKMQSIDEGDVSRKSYKRLHRWRYSPTAAYGNNEVHLHPYKSRRLSVAEVLAIQSAPKEFQLPNNMTLTDKFKTVGNGVPYLVAKELSQELGKVLIDLENAKEK